MAPPFPRSHHPMIINIGFSINSNLRYIIGWKRNEHETDQSDERDLCLNPEKKSFTSFDPDTQNKTTTKVRIYKFCITEFKITGFQNIIWYFNLFLLKIFVKQKLKKPTVNVSSDIRYRFSRLWSEKRKKPFSQKSYNVKINGFLIVYWRDVFLGS